MVAVSQHEVICCGARNHACIAIELLHYSYYQSSSNTADVMV